MISLRAATPDDYPAIGQVVERAFARPDEARLVAALRASPSVLLELVAEEEDQLAGHILFTELPLVGPDRTVRGAALAPLSVDPPLQRRGIGGALIKMALALLLHQGVEVVVVVGDPDYYTRFGFAPEQAAGLTHPFPPGPHFMAIELEPGVLEGFHGQARYAPEFGL